MSNSYWSHTIRQINWVRLQVSLKNFEFFGSISRHKQEQYEWNLLTGDGLTARHRSDQQFMALLKGSSFPLRQWESQDLVKKKKKGEKQCLVKFSEPHLFLCESKVGAVLCFRAEVQINNTCTCNYILSKWDCSAAAETWADFQKNKNTPKIAFCKRRLCQGCKIQRVPKAQLLFPLQPSLPSHSHRVRFFFFFFISFSCLTPAQLSLSKARAGWGVQGLESPHLAAAHELLAGNLQPEQLETDPTKSSFCILKWISKGSPDYSAVYHTHMSSNIFRYSQSWRR